MHAYPIYLSMSQAIKSQLKPRRESFYLNEISPTVRERAKLF